MEGMRIQKCGKYQYRPIFNTHTVSCDKRLSSHQIHLGLLFWHGQQEHNILFIRGNLHECQVPSVVSDSVQPYGLQPIMGFSRQEYWSGLPCPPPGDLTHGSNTHLLCLLHWHMGSLPRVPPGKHKRQFSTVIKNMDLDSYCCSVTQWCQTLCDPMDCSTPGLPVPHHIPKCAQVHVHCIGDAIQPSHPLMPSSPSAL